MPRNAGAPTKPSIDRRKLSRISLCCSRRYEPGEAAAEAVGKTPDALPALRIDVTGMVTASMRDAGDSELARAKIEASQTGDRMRTNLNSFAELAADYVFLFNDLEQLVLKENEDLVSLIKVRISEHQRAEEIRLEAQREQIRQEEARRLEREANERAAAANAAGKAPVVTPAANSVEPPARRANSAAPSAKVPPKPTKLEAKVTDLEALMRAVYEGRAPFAVLTVNWAALDDLVLIHGDAFSMDGVELQQVAA